MLDRQQKDMMRQAGIMVLGFVFVMWCWRSTRNAEEGHKRKRSRSPKAKTNPEGTQLLDNGTPLKDPQQRNNELPNISTPASGRTTPQRPSSPTLSSGPPSPINDEIRFTAQTSTDGTRVLKLESRSLADQGDSPSTRAFYEILGRYSDIVSEKEGSGPDVPPPHTVQAPTEAILAQKKKAKPSKSKLKKNKKAAKKKKNRVAGYGTTHTSSSEGGIESEEEEEEGEESDLGHRTSLPPPRAVRSNSKKHLGGMRLGSTRHMRTNSEHARRRFEDRHTHNHQGHHHPQQQHRHSHSAAASTGSMPPISPALRSANFPRRLATAPPPTNYYLSGGSAGYRSEGNVGSSLHSRSAHFRTSTRSGSARRRSTSATRSANSLPAHARRHRAQSVHAHGGRANTNLLSSRMSSNTQNAASTTTTPNTTPSLPPVGLNDPSPIVPPPPSSLSLSSPSYQSSSRNDSNNSKDSSPQESSLSPPPPVATDGSQRQQKSSSQATRVSPGGGGASSSGYNNYAASASASAVDNGLDTEREWDTDSMSTTTFSLADSFENDSTASNRVFATANVAAFSESDSYYRDEVVSLKRASHSERIHRLKKLRESSQIPVSLTSQNMASSPGVSKGSLQDSMVFGPYSDDSQSFFKPRSSVAPQVLSDVEEGDESAVEPPAPRARVLA